MSVAHPLPHVRQHLDLYREQVSQETCLTDGCELDDTRRHLEELVSLGIAFYLQIKGASLKVQEAIEKGELEYSLEISKHFSDLYSQWLEAYPHIAECVQHLAAKGVEVEKFGRYKEYASRVRLHCFGVERMLDAGPTLPLRESLDVLRSIRGSSGMG